MRTTWPGSAGLRPAISTMTSPSCRPRAGSAGARTTSTPSLAWKYSPRPGVSATSSMSPQRFTMKRRMTCSREGRERASCSASKGQFPDQAPGRASTEAVAAWPSRR